VQDALTAVMHGGLLWSVTFEVSMKQCCIVLSTIGFHYHKGGQYMSILTKGDFAFPIIGLLFGGLGLSSIFVFEGFRPPTIIGLVLGSIGGVNVFVACVRVEPARWRR
jgi:hypothetical protein